MTAAVCRTTAAMANVAPTVNAGVDRTVNEGDTVMLSGSFLDPGQDDTHTFQWQVKTSDDLILVEGAGLELEFEDLTIPLTDIRMQITRVYDTLDANQSGDFGFGWSMGLAEARIRETVPVTEADRSGLAGDIGLFGSGQTITKRSFATSRHCRAMQVTRSPALCPERPRQIDNSSLR